MGVKVSNLTTRTSPTAGDFVPITDNNGIMYKITTSDLANYLALLAGSGGGDITRPFVLGSVVTSASPGVVQVTFSESVPTLSVAGWSFKKGGTAWGVSSVSQTASTVWAFTMVSNASSGDALLMSYSQASGNTLDTAGNELTGFTDVSVTNNISGGGDVTAPTVVSRTIVASDKIRVVYSENVNASTAGHVFTIDGGSFVPTSATSYTSTTVDYIVATTMTSGSTATHTYSTQGTGSGTRDAALNQLGAFSAQSVTNGLSSGGATWTKKANTTITTNVGGFWEYKPSTYSPTGTKIPAIIAFHGGGAQGTGSSTDLNLLLNEGVPQQINAEGFGYEALVICPQYTGGAPSGALIEAVIDYVIANYNIDTSKLHLTGLSFGGAILGNWAVSGTISKVASISVLCSYFDVNSTAVSRLKAAGMPIRLYHGDADSVAPVTNSRNWFNSLNATTSIVPATEKYEIVGAEHNIWTDVYPSAAVFGGKNWAQWHLEQQRAGAATYLTFTSLDTDLELYNSNKGVRKSSAGNGSLNLQFANQTIAVNERLVVRIDSSTMQFFVGIHQNNTETSLGNTYSSIRLTGSGTIGWWQQGNSAYLTGSPVSVDSTYYAIYRNGSDSYKFQKSNNLSTWTDIGPAAGPGWGHPTNANIFVFVEGGSSTLDGFLEIFKLA